MRPKLAKTRKSLTKITLVLLAALIALPSTLLKALDERQLITFAATFTEASASENSVVIRLKRHTGDPLIRQALALPLQVRYPQSTSTIFAYFPAGSSEGTCTVQTPSEVGSETDFCIILEIPETDEIKAFSRCAHVIRKKSQVVKGSHAVINAVIFSGVETPSKAVESSGIQSSVNGGVVALGGSPSPVSSFQTRIEPQPEYASGEWTPPLCPYVMVIQFSNWKSQSAQ